MASLIVKILLKICSMLPLRASHTLGKILGYLVTILPNRAQQVSAINIKLCFPELDPAEQKKLVHQSLIETGKTITEMGAIWYWKPEKLFSLIKKIHNQQLLTDALKQDKGVLLMTPHLGCWEILNFYLSQQGPFTCMYKPPRISGLNNIILRARKRMGSILAPTTASGIKALYSALKKGQMVGVLPDQNPGKGQGIFAPFFGIPSNTMPLVLRLAKKTKPTVLLIYSIRLKKGAGFDLVIQKLDDDIYDADPVVAATSLNKVMEKSIRQTPEQYQWSYKKFKYQPDGRKYYR